MEFKRCESFQRGYSVVFGSLCFVSARPNPFRFEAVHQKVFRALRSLLVAGRSGAFCCVVRAGSPACIGNTLRLARCAMDFSLSASVCR